MKMKHWVFIILVAIGALFLLHNYMGHGGFAGVRRGIGLNGGTA